VPFGTGETLRHCRRAFFQKDGQRNGGRAEECGRVMAQNSEAVIKDFHGVVNMTSGQIEKRPGGDVKETHWCHSLGAIWAVTQRGSVST